MRQYYMARRKGYSPAAAGSLVGGAIIISLFAALFTTIGIDDHDWSNAQNNAFVFRLRVSARQCRLLRQRSASRRLKVRNAAAR